MSAVRAVLMGAPDFFSIRGGANPHTRTALGLRKRVRRDVAVAQWHALAARLTALGVAVFVIPADRRWPGLVYPANAGALVPLEASRPAREKRFVLSNLVETRSGEKEIYRTFVRRLGFSTVEVGSRFEGEADFFPVGERLQLFTYGTVVHQRFVLHAGIPPWTRRYGFRTERAALDELAALVPDREVLPLELRLEAYYHGDTCLAAFGYDRGFVLAYLDALTPEARARLVRRLGGRLVEIGGRDAAIYAANAFRLSLGERELLFLPEGVSAALLDEIGKRGAEPVAVDVSEFWRKGGGSVKCMIGDLGPLDEPPTPEIAEFRERVRYRGTLISSRSGH